MTRNSQWALWAPSSRCQLRECAAQPPAAAHAESLTVAAIAHASTFAGAMPTAAEFACAVQWLQSALNGQAARVDRRSVPIAAACFALLGRVWPRVKPHVPAAERFETAKRVAELFGTLWHNCAHDDDGATLGARVDALVTTSAFSFADAEHDGVAIFSALLDVVSVLMCDKKRLESESAPETVGMIMASFEPLLRAAVVTDTTLVAARTIREATELRKRPEVAEAVIQILRCAVMTLPCRLLGEEGEVRGSLAYFCMDLLRECMWSDVPSRPTVNSGLCSLLFDTTIMTRLLRRSIETDEWLTFPQDLLEKIKPRADEPVTREWMIVAGQLVSMALVREPTVVSAAMIAQFASVFMKQSRKPFWLRKSCGVDPWRSAFERALHWIEAEDCWDDDEDERNEFLLRLRSVLALGESATQCLQCEAKRSDAGVKLQLCAACRLAPYCSAECATAHWPTHKKDPECKAIRREAKQQQK